MYHAQAWAGFFYLTWLHTFLENGRAYTKGDLRRALVVALCFGRRREPGGFAGDTLVKRIGLKWGRRLIGTVALGAAALFTVATIFTQDKVLVVLLLACGYGCSDFALPTAWAVCLDVGHKHAGAVTGAMNMAGQTGCLYYQRYLLATSSRRLARITRRWSRSPLCSASQRLPGSGSMRPKRSYANSKYWRVC